MDIFPNVKMDNLNKDFWKNLGFLNGLSANESTLVAEEFSRVSEYFLSIPPSEYDSLLVVANYNDKKYEIDLTVIAFGVIRKIVTDGKKEKLDSISAEEFTKALKEYIETEKYKPTLDKIEDENLDVETEIAKTFANEF